MYICGQSHITFWSFPQWWFLNWVWLDRCLAFQVDLDCVRALFFSVFNNTMDWPGLRCSHYYIWWWVLPTRAPSPQMQANVSKMLYELTPTCQFCTSFVSVCKAFLHLGEISVTPTVATLGVGGRGTCLLASIPTHADLGLTDKYTLLVLCMSDDWLLLAYIATDGVYMYIVRMSPGK